MFIKKIGYLVLVKLKLFQILAKLSPFVMLFSLVLIFFTVDLKEQYKFQQPSLKTKIFDVQQRNTMKQLDFMEIFEGIRIKQVEGVLNNECILITFHSSNQENQQIINIYHTLINQPHNSKNVVLMSYQNEHHLQSFFQWYYNPFLNKKLSFGVIRVGLNIQIKIEQTYGEDSKDKAYLKLYSSTLHPDLDYFQASKELLEKMAIIWSPCQQIHKSPSLKLIKRSFSFTQELIRKQKHLKLLYDHMLCQFSEHAICKVSAHQIMMKNGFQAATIKFILSSQQQKVEKFVVSFVNEFGMQEDHLHSANTFYYPISKTYFAPLLMFLYPSLLFFTAIALYLLQKFIKKDHQARFRLQWKVILMVYAMLTEYCITNDYTFSLCLAGLLLIISMIENVIKLMKGVQQVTEVRIYEIALLAINGLIAIYFGVFCLALSYLAMMLTLMMLVTHIIPKRTVFKFFFKVLFFSSSVIILNFAQINQLQQLYTQIVGMSQQLKLCLIIPILYYSL